MADTYTLHCARFISELMATFAAKEKRCVPTQSDVMLL